MQYTIQIKDSGGTVVEELTTPATLETMQVVIIGWLLILDLLGGGHTLIVTAQEAP